MFGCTGEVVDFLYREGEPVVKWRVAEMVSPSVEEPASAAEMVFVVAWTEFQFWEKSAPDNSVVSVTGISGARRRGRMQTEGTSSVSRTVEQIV